MGGLPALDTFSRYACSHIIPHKLAFGGLLICARRAQTIPAPIALRMYLPSKYANRISVLLFRKIVFVSWLCSGLLSNMPNFTFHASQRHSSVHGLWSRTTFEYLLRVGFLENLYRFVSSHELCGTACAFACETQPGGRLLTDSSVSSVSTCRSREAMGLNPHARVAEGAEAD
jgi:hypothetical protein